jgi:hypothetical protein
MILIRGFEWKEVASLEQLTVVYSVGTYLRLCCAGVSVQLSFGRKRGSVGSQEGEWVWPL